MQPILVSNPQNPKTVFGFIAETFRLRKAINAGSVTVLSCDNVQYNVDVAEKVIRDFVSAQEAVVRICSESSSKLPKFILPTIRDNLEQRRKIRLGAFVIAAWCMCLKTGTTEAGCPLEIIDEPSEVLSRSAKQTDNDPLAFLRLEEIFRDLVTQQPFTNEYQKSLTLIEEFDGVLTAMQSLT